MKTCRTCRRRRRVSSFYTSKPDCKDCYKKMIMRWIAKNRDRRNANYHRLARELRVEILAAYGGKCTCCGETREEFLAIDHVDGNGSAHRFALTGLRRGPIYAWLKRNGWPKGFRILCHNCNCARGFYGYCPHERE